MNQKRIKGQAMGHNGIINYEIDVENNKVEDLKILKHSETSGIFNQVIDRLKQNIISQQSFDVDAVSGATVMTQAILNSAKKAVKDENVRLTPVVKKKPVHQTTRIKTDVVVIGGGEAGLVAACRALSLGQKVVLVEKNGYLGGATILNGSNVTGTGSKVSERIFGKQIDIQDSPQRLAEDVAKECKHTNTVALTNLMVNNIGPAIDFISNFADLNYQKAQTQTPEHSVERQIELPTASSYEFIQKVSKTFTAKGGQVLLGTRVEGLTFNSEGQVNGLTAEADNETVKIKASSVVLAAGGYGANKQMRGPENKGIDYYGPMTSTGDAYIFNEDLNLKTRHLDWYKVYPHGVEVEPGIAKLTTYASKKATDMGSIYINSDGKRIVNESDVYTKFRDAILQQPDKMAYLLMDERTWKEVYKLLVLHDFTENEIKQFFADENHRPIFLKGSLDDIANKAGINADHLVETVRNYQNFVKNGHDPEFGRDKQYLHEYEGSTYYLVEQCARFATTLGGYVADSKNLELVNKQSQPVANYFGAGEVVGGANGHDSMPSMMNTWGISSGYVAGTSATQNANQHKVEGTKDKKVTAIVGTNASKSYNRRLLNSMKNLFESEVDFEICEIKNIPLFNEDQLNDEPLAVKELANKIEESDGVVIAVPEYDHAVPAALKSTIEWLSCAEHPFKDKPVMVVGTSLGIQGTVRAQMNLRQILDAPGVDASIMPGHEFMLPQAPQQFDEEDRLIDGGTEDFLKQCFANFVKYMASTEADKKKLNVS